MFQTLFFQKFKSAKSQEASWHFEMHTGSNYRFDTGLNPHAIYNAALASRSGSFFTSETSFSIIVSPFSMV